MKNEMTRDELLEELEIWEQCVKGSLLNMRDLSKLMGCDYYSPFFESILTVISAYTIELQRKLGLSSLLIDWISKHSFGEEPIYTEFPGEEKVVTRDIEGLCDLIMSINDWKQNVALFGFK